VELVGVVYTLKHLPGKFCQVAQPGSYRRVQNLDNVGLSEPAGDPVVGWCQGEACIISDLTTSGTGGEGLEASVW
jgi:hypothetical protein